MSRIHATLSDYRDTPYGCFTRTENTITFNESYTGLGEVPVSCDVHITIKCEKSGTDYVYDITYTNLVDKKAIKKYKKNCAFLKCHPLAQMVLWEDDESYLEGCIVPANPITFHMIECLMREEIDERGQYNTGVVTEKCYKGQVMRALTQLEV
jgi:hypothetical protein